MGEAYLAVIQRLGRAGGAFVALGALGLLGLGIKQKDAVLACQGLALLGLGGTALVMKKTIDVTQAENKTQSPALESRSASPDVQKEIEKIQAATPPDPDVVAAEKVKDAVSSFDPTAPTFPSRVLAAAKEFFPDRVGSAVWVNVLTGSKDAGGFFEVYRRDRFSADALLGHVTAGAALGYQVLQQGPIAVSVFAGAVHPYSGSLTSGWAPVVGTGIKF